ncbi:MAG: hypothetical protein SFX73_16265 [Kofleriaceae bacterium]|nr:hypothetical protein [Kofleriaceae bacterium]
MGETSDQRATTGAPVAKDAIDPDLVKLARSPSRIGLVTSLGVVLLSVMFIIKLNSDRKFAGTEVPAVVTAADIASGKVAADSFVSVEATPMMSHAIRALRSKAGIGLRVAPARGTDDKLWIVIDGNGWDPPTLGAYTGRLRKLADLPFGSAVSDFAKANPRPRFATAAATRAGFASNKITGVGGEAITMTDGDRIALDVIDPNVATIVASLNSNYPTVQVWVDALAKAGIQAGPPNTEPTLITDGKETKTVNSTGQVRFEVKGPDAVASTTRALEAGKLFAARVDPIQRHYETTWGALKGSTAAGFTLGTATVPDAEIDLVGLYVAKGIPDGAYALLANEKPDQYWYVLPVTVALAVIGLLFAWAFARAVRRDLLPTRA